METYELERQVKSALMGNADLMAFLPDRQDSIYRLQAPSIGSVRHPILVYSVISDVPALSGDNVEIMHSVTIRIHVIDKKRKFTAEKSAFLQICKLVKDIMTNLEFRRIQTTPYITEEEEMSILDFVKLI